jgi:RNA polymerase sigma-70 factor (ECF subfamily)
VSGIEPTSSGIQLSVRPTASDLGPSPGALETTHPLGPADADLLAAIGRGSEPAFDELRRRYRGSVERTCRTVAGTADYEDCAQEAFLRIWQKGRLYDPARGSAAAWITTVAGNVARNHRRAQASQAISAPSQIAQDDSEHVEMVWIEAALTRLPLHERSVIELAYQHDMTQRQIAKLLNTPLGTVKTWTRQGLHRLATLLDEDHPT